MCDMVQLTSGLSCCCPLTSCRGQRAAVRLPVALPCLCVQAFFAYFQSLPGQQRLIGYTVYGDKYYAGPGQDGKRVEGAG